MMIVAVGGGTRPLTTFTDDKRQLREALDRLQPTDTRADLSGAVDLAMGLVNQKKNLTPPDIVIYSDGAVPTLSISPELGKYVHFERVGKHSDNVGIVMMSMRRRVSAQGGLEGVIGIHNYSDAAKSFTLELSVDGRLFDAREMTLAAGEQKTEEIGQLPPEAGLLHAYLDLRDSLASDNDANLILKKADQTPVTLVTDGNLFLSRILALDDTLTLTESKTVPGDLPAGSVLVADLTAVPSLPPGVSALLIGQTDGPIPGTIGNEVENPQVVDWDRKHLVMAKVDLHGMRLARAHVITPSSGVETLIESDAGPIAVAQEVDGRRIVYLGWDLHNSDFPLTVAFPIFMANCLDWLSGERQRALAMNINTGDTLRLPVPAQATTVRLQAPDGAKEDLQPHNGFITLDHLRDVGLYHLTGTGLDQQIAANLFDSRESDLTPKNIALETGSGKMAEVKTGSVKTDNELWRILALLALVLLAAEWWVFHKRIG